MFNIEMVKKVYSYFVEYYRVKIFEGQLTKKENSHNMLNF